MNGSIRYNLTMNFFKNEWDQILEEEFQKEYLLQLLHRLDGEYRKGSVLPRQDRVFRAFRTTPYSHVNVLILGQDPYHNRIQPNGYAFSVNKDVPLPPSLQNIFKELKLEFPDFEYTDGDLSPWARQGVLLLNSILTVGEDQAGSHSKWGWETFTDAVISHLSQRERPMVFILWGNYAKKKAQLIDQRRHKVLTGVHPSPLSANRGFFHGNYFLDANEFLSKQGIQIQWNLKKQ